MGNPTVRCYKTEKCATWRVQKSFSMNCLRFSRVRVGVNRHSTGGTKASSTRGVDWSHFHRKSLEDFGCKHRNRCSIALFLGVIQHKISYYLLLHNARI